MDRPVIGSSCCLKLWRMRFREEDADPGQTAALALDGGLGQPAASSQRVPKHLLRLLLRIRRSSLNRMRLWDAWKDPGAFSLCFRRVTGLGNHRGENFLPNG